MSRLQITSATELSIREDYLVLDRSEVFEPYVRKIFSRPAHDPRYASPAPGVVPTGA
jgi:hypothetical protein